MSLKTLKLPLTLNHEHLNASLNSKASVAKYIFEAPLFCLLLALIISFGGCGKRRPPVPPNARRQLNPANFAVYQQGDRIALVIPVSNSSDGSRPQQVDVYRLAESVNSPLFLTEDEFSARSTLVGSVQLPAAEPSNEVTFYDILAPSNQARRLRYAVRFVNADRQRSALSNFVFYEPVSNTAKSPLLADLDVSQISINLRWQAPNENIDETKPANILGYNVYRQTGTNEKSLRLNASLLSNTDFADKNFRFGADYQYFVRAVSAGPNGIQVESADSNAVRITPKDVFPPAAPEGLTIAAAPGNLSVFFAANAEPDVIGYNIFRTNKQDLPLNKWQKLNDAPISATSFQDAKVESGQRYFYYVTAVDSAGNVSQPSEIISETAP